MSDLYTEVMVEKKVTVKETAIKISMIFLTVLTAVVGLTLIPLALIAAVVLGIMDYIFIPKLSVEYEYLYVNGELDIDRIYSRSKRKKGGSFDLSKMEVMAPVNSHHLDSYRNNTSIKTVDFSSGNPDAKVFAVIIPGDKEMRRILFEPNDVMLRDIRTKMPRKVFTD